MKIDHLPMPNILLNTGTTDCFSRLSFIPIERLFKYTSIWPQTTEWFCDVGVL